jgi:hypothetical protein
MSTPSAMERMSPAMALSSVTGCQRRVQNPAARVQIV